MIVNLRSLDRATDEARAAGTQKEQGAATVIVAGLTAGLVVVTALPSSVLRQRLQLLAGNGWQLRDVTAA